MNKKVWAVGLTLVVLVILAAVNLLWKFSSGDFSDMPFFRQINVVAAIILIVSGSFGIYRLIYTARKGKPRK